MNKLTDINITARIQMDDLVRKNKLELTIGQVDAIIEKSLEMFNEITNKDKTVSEIDLSKSEQFICHVLVNKLLEKHYDR